MRQLAYALTVLSAFFLISCAHYGASVEARKTVPVDAALTIAGDGAGGYVFSYKAPFADEKGNFDFSRKGAAFNTIKLTFTIADGSVLPAHSEIHTSSPAWLYSGCVARRSALVCGRPLSLATSSLTGALDRSARL